MHASVAMPTTTGLLIHKPPDATIGSDGTNDTRNPDARAAPQVAMAPASLTLPGRADQVGSARRWLAEIVAGLPTSDDIILAASELMANAVSHSESGRRGGTFTVCVTFGADLVRVEVADEGGRWGSEQASDDLSQDDPADQRGRGLSIVACLAIDWGIGGDESGRTAWCVLPTRTVITGA